MFSLGKANSATEMKSLEDTIEVNLAGGKSLKVINGSIRGQIIKIIIIVVALP